MASDITSKLLQLDTWKKQMIVELSKYGIFMNFDSPLKKVFDVLNYCASYKFWHYENSNAVRNTLPMDVRNNGSFYDRGGFKQKGTYDQLSEYDKNGTVVQKIDTIFNWKKKVVDKLKESSSLSTFNETTPLNTIKNSIGNIMGSGVSNVTSAYNILLPKYAPNPTNSKYFSSMSNINMINSTIVGVNVLGDRIESTYKDSQGNTHTYYRYDVAYSYLNNGWHNLGSFSFFPPTEYYYRNYRDITEEGYKQFIKSISVYPMLDFNTRINVKEGMKYQFFAINPAWESFFKYDSSKDPWKPIYNGNLPYVAKYTEYGYPFLYSKYGQEEFVTIIDNLPYKFKMYFVENNINRKIDGLLGANTSNTDIPGYTKNSDTTMRDFYNGHTHDTFSLFIDFTDDRKFLNPYERSLAILPLENAGVNGVEYMKRNMLNTAEQKVNSSDYDNINLYMTSYDNNYAVGYSEFSSYTNKYSGSYRLYNPFVRYTSDNRYNSGGAGLYGNPTPPTNYYGSNNSGMQAVNIDTGTYGDNAWLFKKIFSNESLYYGMGVPYSIGWDYYDITDTYSSYLLGIFPVNDDDTIDYSKPILYRHVIPSTAYGGVNGASDNLVSLKDVLDRDTNPSYEFLGATDTDGNTIEVMEKFNYENYSIPASAFFYRNENSPSTMYKRGEDDNPVAPSFNIDKYLNKSGTTITLPNNIGRIAIKLYHSLPNMNVPRYLRRVFDYDESFKSSHLKRPYSTIEETIYDEGKPLKYYDNDTRNRPSGMDWRDPRYNNYRDYSFTDTIGSIKNSYYYDVSESILSTKAVIIDPAKATYDNVPLLDKGVNLKVHKITKDAIYVMADTLDYDYVIDIIHKAARWWVNLPNSDGTFNRTIFPDSIEEVSIPILNDIVKTSSVISKYYKHNNNTYNRFNEERDSNFILRKALKLNINLGDVLDNTVLYNESTSTVNDLAHFQVNTSDFSLIYVNFSMSNVFFTNDTFLNYDKMDKESDLKKFIKEIDGQLIFHTITPKDEDSQKTNVASNKGFGNYVTPGTSYIVYSIGLTSNVFTKLKFKERKYNVKMLSDDTSLKDRNTIKDVTVPILNDYVFSATPINYIGNSPFKINIKEGIVATKDELDSIATEKFRFPFNLNEMTIDEIKTLFQLSKTDGGNYDSSYNFEPYIQGYNSDKFANFKNYYSNKTSQYGYGGNTNSDTQFMSNENAYVAVTFGSFLYSILLTHYMLCPKIYNYDLKVVDSKLTLNFAIEKYEDRKIRLNKEFKEQEDARKENDKQRIMASAFGNETWVQQESERINKGSIFDFDYNLGMNDSYITYMRDIFVKYSLNNMVFQNQSLNNTYDRRSMTLSSFKMLFDMNWLFIYTPGIDKEKDKVIKDIVHKTFSILPKFKGNLTSSNRPYMPNGYYDYDENKKYRNQETYINSLGPIGYIWAVINNNSNSSNYDNVSNIPFATMYKIINNIFDKTENDYNKYSSYFQSIGKSNSSDYYLKDVKDYPLFTDIEKNLSYMNSFNSPVTGGGYSGNYPVIPYALTNNTDFTQIYTYTKLYDASSNNMYSSDMRYHNILSYYKDAQYGLLNKKKLITYRTFKKSVNKPIINPLMGRAIEFTDDLTNIPKDTKAVIYRLSLKDLYYDGPRSDMRMLYEVISNKRDKFIEYARKGISVIIVVNCDDITNTNHMPVDLTSYVHEYNNEYGSGIGFDIIDDKFNIPHPDVVRSLTNVFHLSGLLNINEYIVDGLYIRVKNALISYMDCIEFEFTTEIKYRLYDYRKNLMKKGVILGYNLIEFPKTIEKFKDVLDNNFDDVMAEINRGTIKYYSKGDYDIPEEYKDRWNEIISNIGYKIALNDIYITTNMPDYTKVYNANNGFSFNFINLSRCGVLRDHKTEPESIVAYFSNVINKLKVTFKFSSYRKRDMAHLLDIVYNRDMSTTAYYGNKDDNILGEVSEPDFPIEYASDISHMNDITNFENVLQEHLFDFKTFNLNSANVNIEAILKNENTNSYMVKKTRKVKYQWDTTERDENYYELENTTGTLSRNIFNLSGNSDYYVAFKLVLSHAGVTNIPCEFKETEINFANAGYESFNGVILNDFTLDSVFTSVNNYTPPKTT